MIRSRLSLLPAVLLLFSLRSFAQLGPLNWTEPQKVEANNVFLIWHDTPQVGNQTHAKIYDYDFRNDMLAVDERISGTPPQTSAGTGLAAYTNTATGKFNVSARESVVAIWGPDAGGIHVMIPAFDTSAGGWSNTGETTITGSIQNDGIYVRTLDLDGDSLDEFVVAYLDNNDSIRFRLYDVDSLMQPTLIAAYCDRKAINLPAGRVRYAIETGDFNGDGDDELALLHNDGTSGFQSEATVYIYDFNGSTLEPKGSEQLAIDFNSPISEFQMGAVAGNYLPDDKEELAICMSMVHGSNYRKMQVQLVTASSDLQTVSSGFRFPFSVSQGSMYLGAASGDLFGDEQDEIVLAAGKTAFLISVANIDSLIVGQPFQLLPSNFNAFGPYLSRAMMDHVKISDVDQDGRRDIVTVFDHLGSGSAGFYTRVFAVDAAGAVSLSGELKFDEDDPVPGTDPPQYDYRPYSIAVGNYDGMNFTIGEPTHYVAQGVVQPVVILNAPPVHFDEFDGTTYDLNDCYNGGSCDFGAKYRKQTTTSVEVSTTVQSDWVTSAGLSTSGSVSVGAEVAAEPLGVGASVSTEVSVDYENHLLLIYGAHFSNTSSSSTTLSIGVEVTAKEDDRIYSTVTEYDVWEYPVYHGNEPFPRNTILSWVPLNVQATWFPSKSYNAVSYVPDHEVGNVLSYRAYPQLDQNPNVDQTIAADYNNDSFVLDGSSNYDWFVSMTDFQSSSADTTRELGVDIGIGYGIFRFDGDYGGKKMRTHTTTVTNQIDLNVHLGSVDMGIGDAKYTVTPYAYWDTHGALIVDYAAKPEIAPPGFPHTWWQNTYADLPDPTFVLPWKLDPEKGFAISEPAKRQQTKDIFFYPNTPLEGDTLAITARVRNFSLAGTTSPVTASFYLGDPTAGGVPIIGLTGTNEVSTSGPLPAQGREDVELRWVVPANLGFYPRIYVVLDEAGQIDELHENNNMGFNVMAYNGGVGVPEIPDLKNEFTLAQCFPNPFSTTTTIDYTIPTDGITTITVFDQMGRTVATLQDGPQHAGTYRTTFDGSGVGPGIYYYGLRCGAHFETRKMVLVK